MMTWKYTNFCFTCTTNCVNYTSNIGTLIHMQSSFTCSPVSKLVVFISSKTSFQRRRKTASCIPSECGRGHCMVVESANLSSAASPTRVIRYVPAYPNICKPFVHLRCHNPPRKHICLFRRTKPRSTVRWTAPGNLCAFSHLKHYNSFRRLSNTFWNIFYQQLREKRFKVELHEEPLLTLNVLYNVFQFWIVISLSSNSITSCSFN